MKIIPAKLITKVLKLRTAIFGAALLAGLLLFAQAASATTAYYVSAVEVYARSKPQSYAMGRLYTDERMDIQYVDSNGWATAPTVVSTAVFGRSIAITTARISIRTERA